jgi:hypothetical protein
MKKTITIITLLCLGAITARGQENETDRRFRPGEWDISPYGTYVDKEGGKWGAGVAGTYFLNTSFGIGASTYWTQTGGTIIDNLAAEGYLRVPILKSLSPYGVASIGYEFEQSRAWFETVGGGIDFRLFKRFAAFSDLQYRIVNDSESRNGVFLRFGLRFAL